ncbi:hypothetical protein BGW38_008888 [Lunasporangiospora selenospora]|uniref:Uncharacterized protein n=1 Tax=Lunasporangiospora selenospora TaxID=979761 RepID=A0A9P6FXR2_9FUNG|nr:hypothetical protein BGW38_008888 [Lunasporangiospora selenospora]
METILFADSPSLRRILNRHAKGVLINTAIRWIALYPGDLSDEAVAKGNTLTDIDDSLYQGEGLIRDKVEERKSLVKKSYESMRTSGTKKNVIDRILWVDWKRGLNPQQVAELDLAYYQENSHLWSWKAPEVLMIPRILSHYFLPFFKHHVEVKQDKNSTWIRISIFDGLVPNTLPAPADNIYFIWIGNSDYILSGTVKEEWRIVVTEALLKLFNADKLEERQLSGRSPESLADMLLHKESQGALSTYRMNQLEDNPLVPMPRKRKAIDLDQKYAEGIEHLRAEDMDRIVSRDCFVAADFGPNAQPRLEKVDINLRLPFTQRSKDFDYGKGNSEPFPIKVTLEGTSVIEGLKELALLGIAENPLPKFLVNLHSNATNSVTIEHEDTLDQSGSRA